MHCLSQIIAMNSAEVKTITGGHDKKDDFRKTLKGLREEVLEELNEVEPEADSTLVRYIIKFNSTLRRWELCKDDCWVADAPRPGELLQKIEYTAGFNKDAVFEIVVRGRRI